MKDKYKTKEQLIAELSEIRRQIAEFQDNRQQTIPVKKNPHIDIRNNKELEKIGLELAISVSEVFEALKKLSSGDPSVKIDEDSDIELIQQLKHMINLTARDIGEIVDQSHEFAMVLAEHFDILHKVSKGDMHARISSSSNVELLESLKEVTNQMIDSIEREHRERGQREKALKDIEALEASILSAIPHAVIGLHERKIIFANESVEKVFGWKPEELIGKGTRILYRTEEEYEEIGRRFYPILENKRTHSEEFVCRGKDGGDIMCRVCTSVIGERLQEKRIIVIYEDVTEHKLAEDALCDSEEKYRTLVENVNIGIYRNDGGADGSFLQANSAMMKIFGYDSIEEFMKINISDLYQNPRERKQFLNKIQEKGFVKDEALKLRKKDGTPIWCSVTAKVQYHENRGIGWIDGVMEDITDRKRAEDERCKLEAQLLQAQKMEAIGQLAGGIAHDFNNILTAIIGYGNLLKMQATDSSPNNYITYILDSAERAAKLTQALLAFSRRQMISPKPASLNEIIRGVENILSRIIGEDIQLAIDISDKNLMVMADCIQLEQVLMNLAANARDAMPEGGTLNISTKVFEFDEEFIKAYGYGNSGIYALITVEDTGQGMDEQTKEKIFEPFFTTKETGKGTGLGLAMAYGIVKQHDGYINVYSEPGSGATFKIYLPLIAAKSDETPETETFVSRGGTETLLVAEDDMLVSRLIKEVLERAGYTVISAVNGDDAIRKFNENKDRIQLLILDVIMPKKNGKEAYEAIKKISPDMKVIFASGYSADIVQKKKILEEGLDLIIKPIVSGELLKKVREILDKQV